MKLYDWLELIVLRGQARIGEYLAFSIVILIYLVILKLNNINIFKYIFCFCFGFLVFKI